MIDHDLPAVVVMLASGMAATIALFTLVAAAIGVCQLIDAVLGTNITG